MKQLLVILALLWPASASAELYTGEKLHTFCAHTKSGEPKRNLPWYGSCVSYLSGLVDAAEWLHQITNTARRTCVPKGVSPEQLRQVWLNHANQHPEELHREASAVAFAAFEKSWPCNWQ